MSSNRKKLEKIPVVELREKIEEKLQQLIKKVQDRKTQEIFEDNNIELDEIQEIFKISDNAQTKTINETYSTISILATMKSIAHTIQSKARWQQFCKDTNTLEEIYTFSSKGDFKKKDHIIVKIAERTHPKNIVMCTHKIRITDILELARYINEINPELKRPRRLRIYLDEFDKYAPSMRDIVNNLVILDSVEKIVLVTATPRELWGVNNGWENIFVLNPVIYDTTNNYLGIRDCRHFDTDLLTSNIPYNAFWVQMAEEESWNTSDVKLIETHHRIIMEYPDILLPNNVIFAPGNITRVSHELVARFWNHKDFKASVAIINGERTKDGYYGRLYLVGGQVVDIPHIKICHLKSREMIEYFKNKDDDEKNMEAQLNEIIADLYMWHQLNKHPFVITGRLCVERAQTLVHPVWGTFTNAIYFKHSSPEDAYQQQRQLGLVRNWPTYRGIPRVFCSNTFCQDVLILEERASNFARLNHGRLASVSDYIAASEGDLTSKEEREAERKRKDYDSSRIVEGPAFRTIDEVNTFLSIKLKTTISINEFHVMKGYKLSTRLNTYYKKRKADLTEDDRLIYSNYKSISIGLNISSKSGQPYMVYPVYDTISSPPSDVKYYVRYLPPE